jgi:glycosyltransferase involved in cell wall biosynthesis
VDFALDFIRRRQSQPFFLYGAFCVPHAPFDIPSVGQYESRSWTKDQKHYAAMVTRLTEQKGVDVVIQAIPDLLAAHAQLVVLGTGDESLRDELQAQAKAHPGRVLLTHRFDDELARRIYAGADMFLMPSRYEPCGLGQIIAMRYGCVPIGRHTGGLGDTILDLDEHPETATGSSSTNSAASPSPAPSNAPSAPSAIRKPGPASGKRHEPRLLVARFRHPLRRNVHCRPPRPWHRPLE